jgi:hypothetical protein
VPLVVGLPTGVAPWRTVKMTLPSLTVPPAELTVAVNVTFCAPLLNVAVAFAAAVVVGAT